MSTREFRWILGGIGALVVFALVVLLVVVTLYRTGPIRGHPPSPAPTATASP